MTTQEIVKRYNITIHNDNQIAVGRNPKSLKAAELQAIKEAKPEILAYLKAEKQAKEDAAKARTAAIDGIEGLDILRKAINDHGAYHDEVNRRFEDEMMSGIMPAKPTASISEIEAQYPRAAAYIKAENWTLASNVDKYSAGKRAVERIINGEDHAQVIADMETEWSNAATGMMD